MMNIEQLRKQAKQLVKAARAGDRDALSRLGGRTPILANAQLALARELGFASWPALLANYRGADVPPLGIIALSEQARAVMVAAQQETVHRNTGLVGTEPILLGLIREGTLNGRALESFGLDRRLIRASILSEKKNPESEPIEFAASAHMSLRLARAQARALGHGTIDSGHILLGLLNEKEGAATRVLYGLGVDIGLLRKLILGSFPPTHRVQSPIEKHESPRHSPASASSPRAAAERLLDAGLHVHSARLHRVAQRQVTYLRGVPEGRVAPASDVSMTHSGESSGGIDNHTVRFIKERTVHGRHLFAVSFVGRTRSVMPGTRVEMGRMLVATPSPDGGWIAYVGSGLSPSVPPPFDLPYAAFSAHWNNEGFHGAARVHKGAANVTSVRLHFPDGTIAESDAADDLALFFVRQPDSSGEVPLQPFLPTKVEIMDGARVVATQSGIPPPKRGSVGRAV